MTILDLAGNLAIAVAPKLVEGSMAFKWVPKPSRWRATWNVVNGGAPKPYAADIVYIRMLSGGRVRGEGDHPSDGQYNIEGIGNDEREISLFYFGRDERFRISGAAFLQSVGRDRKEGLWRGYTKEGSVRGGSVVWERA